jgi:hypothetical protein
MRIRTILAAAAVPAALAASLLGTTAASASVNGNGNPGNGAAVVKTQADANALMAQASQGLAINKNVDVPQGADVQLRWVHITGNLNVEGKLSLASSVIDHDVNVTGPGAGLSLWNDPGNTIKGNLTVNAAGGYYDYSSINTGLGVYSDGQQVGGRLTFTNNTSSRLSFNADPASMTVGSLVYSGNALPYPAAAEGGITVLGTSSIS